MRRLHCPQITQIKRIKAKVKVKGFYPPGEHQLSPSGEHPIYDQLT